MGWSDCGVDSAGRKIGYGNSARCDHAGCKAKIDRGLSYACGGMHGDSEGCEKYFCSDHLFFRYDPDVVEGCRMFCAECAKALDDRRDREFCLALHEIHEGADPIKTAFDVLVRWDESPLEPGLG